MPESNIGAWEAELKVLLEKIRGHPSADLMAERQRVVVLEKLIGDHYAHQH